MSTRPSGSRPDRSGGADGPEDPGLPGPDAGLVGLSTDWSVPWSDLMMVLFVLFVVLYCYDRAERPVPEAFSARAPLDPALAAPMLPDPSLGLASPRDVLERSRAAVTEAALGDVDVVLQDDESVQVSVRGDTFFDLGRADLRPETTAFLDRLAPVLAGLPYVIEVVGHTDSFPVHGREFPTNWELSAARATRVTRYLVERGALDPARFAVRAHSLYRPAVPNDSADNKAQNRRVEIVITRRLPPDSPEG